MLHNTVFIYSFPRCATKLTASIFKQFGYNVMGELYNTHTTVMSNGLVTRMGDHDTEAMRRYYSEHADEYGYYHLRKSIDRNRRITSGHNVITVWHENLETFPFLLSNRDIHWVLLKRNAWDQLRSYCVAWHNKNYEADKTSVAVRVNRRLFEWSYWSLAKVTLMQSWIIANLSSQTVEFNDLISGEYRGFEAHYTVDSRDEHQNLDQLIINGDEVREWMNELDNINNNIR